MTPRVSNGLLEVPVEHVRGGTSTGILLHDSHLPAELPLREELIRRIMGPRTGACRGSASSPLPRASIRSGRSRGESRTRRGCCP